MTGGDILTYSGTKKKKGGFSPPLIIYRNP
jgi:hypothetical protein